MGYESLWAASPLPAWKEANSIVSSAVQPARALAAGVNEDCGLKGEVSLLGNPRNHHHPAQNEERESAYSNIQKLGLKFFMDLSPIFIYSSDVQKRQS